MNTTEQRDNMQSLYDCEACYARPAVAKVHGAFTCYECWADNEEQKELSK